MIGIDFGGTQIKGAEVQDGKIVRTAVRNTKEAKGPQEVLDAIADLARELAPHHEAIGLAIPGEVNAEGRCWRLPNVPGFENVAIGKELQSRLGCRVVVENDATTAALAEQLYGHGRQHPSFLMVTLGTGIGGGLVLGRKLWRGSNGFAGEIGHIPVDRENGWPCACGQTGCLESYCGTKGLIRRYRELGGPEVQTIRPIADACRAGDVAASKTFAAMGRSLAIGISGIQNVLDLDAVVFTGGISASFDLVEPYLRKSLEALSFAPPLAQIPLLLSELGDAAGVVGAAYLPTI